VEGKKLNRYKNGFTTHQVVTSIKSRHLRSVKETRWTKKIPRDARNSAAISAIAFVLVMVGNWKHSN